MANLDRRNLPKYLQLRQLIHQRIEDGTYRPGFAIPSENELAREFGVNRLTVRNAINALVDQRILRRTHGKGTYVTQLAGPDASNSALLGATRLLDGTIDGFLLAPTQDGAEPDSTIFTKARREAGPLYSKLFNVDEKDEVFYLRRLSSLEGTPFSFQQAFVPCDKACELEEIDLDEFTLGEALVFCGINVASASQTVDIVTLERRDARFLEIGPETPVLKLTRTAFDDDDCPVLLSHTYVRTDRCSLSLTAR